MATALEVLSREGSLRSLLRMDSGGLATADMEALGADQSDGGASGRASAGPGRGDAAAVQGRALADSGLDSFLERRRQLTAQLRTEVEQLSAAAERRKAEGGGNPRQPRTPKRRSRARRSVTPRPLRSKSSSSGMRLRKSRKERRRGSLGGGGGGVPPSDDTEATAAAPVVEARDRFPRDGTMLSTRERSRRARGARRLRRSATERLGRDSASSSSGGASRAGATRLIIPRIIEDYFVPEPRHDRGVSGRATAGLCRVRWLSEPVHDTALRWCGWPGVQLGRCAPEARGQAATTTAWAWGLALPPTRWSALCRSRVATWAGAASSGYGARAAGESVAACRACGGGVTLRAPPSMRVPLRS